MSKAKVLLVSIVWLFILTTGVFLYRLWYVPRVAQQQEQQQVETIEATRGNSQYDYRLKLGLDAFSGYAVLRSEVMNQQLRSQSIKVEWVDDGADYDRRLAALEAGELQMAAFPIDALLKASEKRKALPATIVALLDETRGADAVVAYKLKFPNVDALNSPATQFVLVGDSPSETLVRVLMHNFQLEQIKPGAFVRVGNEREVLAAYRQATPQTNQVFVTWEPLVSQLCENDQMHVVTSSRDQSGFIVDALVVNRDFLIKNEAVVRRVLECYFRSLYAYADRDKLIELIRSDAEANGTRLSSDQAQTLVEGIVWKNTQENFAHFGLRSAGVAYVEDMIDRIKRVLIDRGGLSTDPTEGDSSKLFNEQALRELHAASFHPGLSPEAVREDLALPSLSDDQWQRLVPVGTAQVPPLIYARGRAQLTESSRFKLDVLVEKLQSWPNYYVLVRGNASSAGDAQANRKLAQQRAEAAVQYLLSKGVAQTRLRAVEGEIADQTSVTFVLGQPPF